MAVLHHLLYKGVILINLNLDLIKLGGTNAAMMQLLKQTADAVQTGDFLIGLHLS